MTDRLRTTAIEASNSLDFIEKAFRLYDAGSLFTVQRDGLDLSQYPGLEVAERLSTALGGGWGKQSFVPGSSVTPAQILFSSGTEGLPKPIVLSQRNISDVVLRLNTAMKPDETIREYIGVPVTYSFGLGRARAVSAAGGQFYLPERFDPVEIREMLEKGEINAISAVSTLWRVILSAPDAIGRAAEAVRWIEIGSQYMSGLEKAAMRKLFPNARIVQHYGLTEASRTTFLDVSVADEALLESVGTASEAAAVKIGEEGEICIRGAHVALGILNASGRIDPLKDDQGWLHTKDKGAIRDGQLFYEGRLDDQMNIAGVNVNAENLEQVIVDLCSCAGGIAVSSVSDPLRGDAAIVAVHKDIAERVPLIEKAAEIALRKFGVNQRGCIHVFQVEEIPETGTGKVQRKLLGGLFQAHTETNVGKASDRGRAATEDMTATELRVADAWRKVVGQVATNPEETFYDAGGDSLSAVQIGLIMENDFARRSVRATLEGRSLRDVAQAEDEQDAVPAETPSLPERTTATWAINITRGLMALAVMFAHWGPGLFSRLGIGREVDFFLGGVYRMGTEGFATIFGIGLGFFFLPRCADDSAAVNKRLWQSFLLVLSGLTLIAVVRLIRLYILDQEIGGLEIAHAFYNILAYYVVAFATVPLWLRYLNAGDRVVLRALLVVALALPVTWTLQAILPGQLDSILEWPRLLAVANYSYFRLCALVFGGIALGYWFSRQASLTESSKTLICAGAFGMAIAVVVGLDVLPANPLATSKSPFFQSLLGYVFYFCAVVFLVGLFDQFLKSWNDLGSFVRGTLQIMIVIGGLALPIYAFHGIVI
uniref:AMP-binding protein n=1 Tax=uncultured Roseovarius sp. TaxID=293344 RepID=UPI00261A5126